MSCAGGQRLEVEAQQRLGVGGPDVEVPVRVVDRDPVEAGQLGPVGEALLDLRHLRRLIADLGVDLAGDEVLGAELRHQFSEAAALDREQLQHQQGRDRARVGVPEVAEVVVAGDLAAEDGVLLAHPRLEEGVADPREVRTPALGGDQVGDGAAGAGVVEDRRAGVLAQRRAGQQGADEVAVAELAAGVDEEAAVGVAVPGDAEVGAGRSDPVHDHPAVLLEQRVGLVIGEITVRREVHLLQVERQLLEDRPDHRAAHAVAAIDDDLHRPDLFRIDEGERVSAELVPDVDLLEGAAPGSVAEARLDLRLDVADPGVAGERQRSLADQLDAGVDLRVVRGGAPSRRRRDCGSRPGGRASRSRPCRRRAPSRPRRSSRRAARRPSPARSAACRGRARSAARRPACRAAAPGPGRRRDRSRARWSRPSPRRRGRGCHRP